MIAYLYYKRGKKILEDSEGRRYDVSNYISGRLNEEYEIDEFTIDEDDKLIEFTWRRNYYYCDISPIQNEEVNQPAAAGPVIDTRDRPNPSQAPYNFVRLSNTVKGHSGTRDQYGYIEYTIETLTPTFIRGEGEKFYKEGEHFAIPGSSQRGMLLTLCEILSNSRFKNFDADRYMFDRRDYREGGTILAGLLTYTNKGYEVAPVHEDPQVVTSAEQAFTYWFNPGYVEFTTGSFNDRSKKWTFRYSNLERNTNKYLKVPKKVFRQYHSDDMRHKDVPNIFDHCRQRGSSERTQHYFGFPIFYELDREGTIVYISHCKLGRKRFQHNYGDHLPDTHKVDTDNNAQQDFVDVMFGSTEGSSRIYVEPAVCETENPKEYDCAVYPKSLQSPKPKSGKNYLQSAQGNHVIGNWNTAEDHLRGHKLYWHRITADDGRELSWRESRDEIVKIDSSSTLRKQYPDKIQPVMPRNSFRGKIRFEGISKEELGCLLWALRLKKNCAHKIGMGKPLGLGSISISNLKLTTINRQNRYETLFENGDWNLSESDDTSDINDIISEFENFMKKAGDNKEYELRLRELFYMMTFNEEVQGSSQWLERTKYLSFEEFGRKGPLPYPLEVAINEGP